MSETDTEVIPKLCKWIYHSLQERVPFSEVCHNHCSQCTVSYIQSNHAESLHTATWMPRSHDYADLKSTSANCLLLTLVICSYGARAAAAGDGGAEAPGWGIRAVVQEQPVSRRDGGLQAWQPAHPGHQVGCILEDGPEHAHISSHRCCLRHLQSRSASRYTHIFSICPGRPRMAPHPASPVCTMRASATLRSHWSVSSPATRALWWSTPRSTQLLRQPAHTDTRPLLCVISQDPGS